MDLGEDPELIVGGWSEVSLVDVVEHPSFTLWLAYCNLRCPWCSNSDLARGLLARRVKVSDVVEAVRGARPFIEVFHVTGGEPTLQFRALRALFEKVGEETGLKLSLDINGSMPEALRELAPLLYHVGVDVKAPLSEPQLYARVTGVSEPLAHKLVKRVAESIAIASRVPFLELKTTLVPGLLSREDVLRVALDMRRLLPRGGGRAVYVVQQFIPYEGVRGSYAKRKATPSEEVKACAKRVAEVLEFEVYYRTLEEGARRVS